MTLAGDNGYHDESKSRTALYESLLTQAVTRWYRSLGAFGADNLRRIRWA